MREREREADRQTERKTDGLTERGCRSPTITCIHSFPSFKDFIHNRIFLSTGNDGSPLVYSFIPEKWWEFTVLLFCSPSVV